MATPAPRPPKLLFYLPGLVDGGAERVMADIAGSFVARGYDVIVAVDFLADENSPTLDPRIRFFELAGGHGASLRKLARLIADERPAIAVSAIASACFKLVLADMLARLKARGRLDFAFAAPKLVLTYHGFDEYQTGKLSFLGFAALPLMGRYAARIVAVSDVLRDNLVYQWRAYRPTLVRIYNPVAIPAMPEGFDPLDMERRENLVLSVGRLVKRKRFDLLIEAFGRLEDKTTKLVILGNGPERERLQKLIDGLGLSERVSLPGYTRNTGQHFARAKCFALVSEKESFGLVYVEAFAYGLPVIAAADGGPREVLDRGRYGVLLREPTVETLRDALERVLAKPGDPRQRIERARDFSQASGIAQYQELFDSLLQDGKVTSRQ